MLYKQQFYENHCLTGQATLNNVVGPFSIYVYDMLWHTLRLYDRHIYLQPS